MSVYKLKIKTEENSSRVISLLRKFDSAISIGEIRKRIAEDDYIVKYDLLHWDLSEEMAGIDRISKFSNLIRSLEDCGVRVSIYEEDELIDETFFKNRMKMLREIEQEANEDMNREAEL